MKGDIAYMTVKVIDKGNDEADIKILTREKGEPCQNVVMARDMIMNGVEKAIQKTLE